MDHQGVRHADDSGDRCDVADEIEVQLVVERRVDRVSRSVKQERVAVRRRAHDCFGPDIAATARPVVDDKWLAEPFRQPLTQEARNNVLRAYAGNGADDAYRPRGIRVRPGEAR